MECAKKNLQRALAIDDAFMPAFNQLALYYFQLAKKRAGSVKSTGKGSRGRQVVTHASVGKRADVQQLELAALVCSQAIRKNPNYAPIHNTAGLIQNELGQVNGAVGEFATAAKLDPKFFEAQMNFAAVNLGFRGFEQAQAAYTKALAMRPNDYDAHLGLALALRGPITGAENDYDQRVNAVQARARRREEARREPPGRLLQRGHPHAGVQGEGLARQGEAEGAPPPVAADLPVVHRQGERQARVRRRREALEGAHPGHRRHAQVHGPRRRGAEVGGAAQARHRQAAPAAAPRQRPRRRSPRRSNQEERRRTRKNPGPPFFLGRSGTFDPEALSGPMSLTQTRLNKARLGNAVSLPSRVSGSTITL